MALGNHEHRWLFFRPTATELAVRCLGCGEEHPSDWWFDAHVQGFIPHDFDEWLPINRMLFDQGFDRLIKTLTEAS